MVCSHISFNQIITNVDCGEVPTTACAQEADHYDGNDDSKDFVWGRFSDCSEVRTEGKQQTQRLRDLYCSPKIIFFIATGLSLLRIKYKI